MNHDSMLKEGSFSDIEFKEVTEQEALWITLIKVIMPGRGVLSDFLTYSGDRSYTLVTARFEG